MAQRSEYEQYVTAIATASKLAQDELGKLWDSLDKSDPQAVRDAVIATMPGIVDKYGGMAALAAGEYYEAERNKALGGDYSAYIADSVPNEQIESSVRYAAGHLFGGDGNGLQPGADAGLFDGALRQVREAASA